MQILRQKVVKVIQLAVIFVLLLFVPALLFVACQVTSLESGSLTNSQMIDHSAFSVTETPAPYVPLPAAYATSMAQGGNEDVWDGRIDIYKNILQGYADVLSDDNLPQETVDAMILEMAIIQAEATVAAIPIPTDNPNHDYQGYLATSDSTFATMVSSMKLTETPMPTAIESLGLTYSPCENARATMWGNNTRTNSAWVGFLEDEKVFVQIGKNISPNNNLTYGFIGLITPDWGQIYSWGNSISDTETFRLIDVVSNRYLIIEVYEEGLQSEEVWTGGTGEMYYFDMVAREFIAQPTAELLLESFLHVSVTPTPTAVLTPVTP